MYVHRARDAHFFGGWCLTLFSIEAKGVARNSKAAQRARAASSPSISTTSYYSSLSSLYPTGAVQKWLPCRQYQLVSKSYSSSIVVFQIGPLPPLRRKNAAHIKIDWPLLCSQIFWWTPSFSTNRGVIFERFLLNSSADPCTHAKPAPCRHIACAVCTFWILAGTFNLLCCRKECRESSKSAHCGMASVWWWCNRIIYMQRVYSSSL